MKINKNYNKILKTVINKGKTYTNHRRNTKRVQIPFYTFRHEMHKGFPLISTREVDYNNVFSELLWFLRGDSHTRFLKENNNPIWDKDAKNWFNKDLGTDYGLKEYRQITDNKGSDTGKSYPVQWRNYNGNTDQIDYIINAMFKDIMGSRIKLNAWNPSELDKTALPPCHTGFQIIGVPLENDTFGFELHWQQRSCDLFLGIPYNIASYAALGVMLEKITGYKFLTLQGDLKCVHLYDNSIIETLDLLQRDTKAKKVDLLFDVDKVNYDILEADNVKTYQNFDFTKVTLDDFKLCNYEPQSKINVKMLEPKSI